MRGRGAAVVAFASSLIASAAHGQPAGGGTAAKEGAPSATGGCLARLKALVSGDLASGAGLPPGCTRADVERVLGKPRGTVEDPLGYRLTMVAYRRADRSGHSAAGPLLIGYGDDGRVLLIEVREPRLAAGVDAILKSLGEPDEVFPRSPFARRVSRHRMDLGAARADARRRRPARAQGAPGDHRPHRLRADGPRRLSRPAQGRGAVGHAAPLPVSAPSTSSGRTAMGAARRRFVRSW